MQDDFKVKTPVFEGPLEVLLGMVEKRKLFINDIALSQVADDYISHVQSIQSEKGYPMAEVAQFILIASTLLLIKSKSLLPTLTLTDEEERSVSDLELRLKIYQRLKIASETISKNFGKCFDELRNQGSTGLNHKGTKTQWTSYENGRG